LNVTSEATSTRSSSADLSSQSQEREHRTPGKKDVRDICPPGGAFGSVVHIGSSSEDEGSKADHDDKFDIFNTARMGSSEDVENSTGISQPSSVNKPDPMSQLATLEEAEPGVLNLQELKGQYDDAVDLAEACRTTDIGITQMGSAGATEAAVQFSPASGPSLNAESPREFFVYNEEKFILPNLSLTVPSTQKNRHVALENLSLPMFADAFISRNREMPVDRHLIEGAYRLYIDSRYPDASPRSKEQAKSRTGSKSALAYWRRQKDQTERTKYALPILKSNSLPRKIQTLNLPMFAKAFERANPSLTPSRQLVEAAYRHYVEVTYMSIGMSRKKAALEKLNNEEAEAYWKTREKRCAEKSSGSESGNASRTGGDTDMAEGSSDHNEPKELRPAKGTEDVQNHDELSLNPPNTSALSWDLHHGKDIPKMSGDGNAEIQIRNEKTVPEHSEDHSQTLHGQGLQQDPVLISSQPGSPAASDHYSPPDAYTPAPGITDTATREIDWRLQNLYFPKSDEAAEFLQMQHAPSRCLVCAGESHTDGQCPHLKVYLSIPFFFFFFFFHLLILIVPNMWNHWPSFYSRMP
jgi:hypothetical protein